MPVYEYHCEECGRFSAIRKMAESGHPANCTTCGALSARVISVPNFALLASGRRLAHERNEKSAHEPKAAKRSGCGCLGSHSCNTSKSVPTGNGLQMQTKKTARPWMLGH